MLALGANWVTAKEAVQVGEEPWVEARMLHLSEELRCLVCQNETIAASHAELAIDLRKQIAVKLEAGQSKQEILDFIRGFVESEGMPPTRAELARAFGFKSPASAEEHLRALENISRQLRDDAFCRELKAAKAPADIQHLLEAADNHGMVS
jgi:hypothetical protein